MHSYPPGTFTRGDPRQNALAVRRAFAKAASRCNQNPDINTGEARIENPYEVT